MTGKYSKEHKYLLRSLFITQLLMGTYVLIVGNILPQLKQDYMVDYKTGAAMMAVKSVGYFCMGLMANILPRYIGIKKTYLIFSNLSFIGLLLMTLTGNPFLLLIDMMMIGLAQGLSGTLTDQMVNNLTDNNASALNLLTAFYAIGACLAPLIVLICGVSWKIALYIVVILGVINFLLSFRVSFDERAYIPEKKAVPDFGFLKKKSFWVCVVVLCGYMPIENIIIGWLVTYLVDCNLASDAMAQVISIILWIALMIGRLLTTVIVKYIRPKYLIAFMTLGAVICFTIMIHAHAVVVLAVMAFGIGLFIAGMYATALGDTGDLMKTYPSCMGFFMFIPGITSMIGSGAVGLIADQAGIRNGMLFVYVCFALLAFGSVWNLLWKRKPSA